MSADPVLLQSSGAIARLTLNRPEKLNALSPSLIERALELTKQVAESDARVMIVSGAGERAFSAGVDLEASSSPSYGVAEAKAFSNNARELARTWEKMPQAVIVKVRGYCFTGGLELALGADLIVAADTALFSDTHAKLGFKPGWGLSARLPRRIGIQRAKEMSFTARRLSAAEAVSIGLILEAVPLEELDARVEALATSIIANSAGSVAAYKDLYRHNENLTLDGCLDFEATTKYRISDLKERKANTVARLRGA